jgi:hypothetical protein
MQSNYAHKALLEPKETKDEGFVILEPHQPDDGLHHMPAWPRKNAELLAKGEPLIVPVIFGRKEKTNDEEYKKPITETHPQSKEAKEELAIQKALAKLKERNG